jgi:hypothetical protein
MIQNNEPTINETFNSGAAIKRDAIASRKDIHKKPRSR